MSIAPFAVSLGDPAGVGPEIVAKAWEQRHSRALPCFFAVGDMASLSAVWDGPVVRIEEPGKAATIFNEALPCLHIDDGGPVIPGRPSYEGARSALQSLELSAGLARSGSAGGIVTAPISKKQLYSVGFTHPGQTEFIAERCGVARSNAVMMLVGPSLRVVPITTHLPLKDVFDVISIELIKARAHAAVKGLQKNFAIDSPRLALAGINPHAGEHGTLGMEEIEIFAPAIEQLRAEGIDISGPWSADSMFHERARAQYDAALCPYHDQALIPVKTLHFDEGVNMTLGLPIVRTSPDHGTAFGIAGKGEAHPGAMIAAIEVAAISAENRATYCRAAG